MELYIRMKDGVPFEHPILGGNFRSAFPTVSTDKLPPEFAVFVRVPMPLLTPYQEYLGAKYVLSNGVVTDEHNVRDFTQQERNEKIAYAMSQPHPDGWVFDEAVCEYKKDLDAEGAAPNVIG